MHHRNWLAPVVLGLTLAGATAPAVAGGGRGGGLYGGAYGGAYGGGYCGGLRSVNSLRNGNRLYRHRSGFLYGASRLYAYPQYGGYPYASGGGGPVIVPAPDQSCGVSLDPRQDFDCRRDRLLRAASDIDVSYLFDEPSEDPATVGGPGWVFLRDGEPAKALGRFTARLMRSPGDGASKVGYALAAALLGDDAAAAAVMEDVLRSDPAAVRSCANAGVIDGVTHDLLERYAAALDAEPTDPAARLMTVALHAIRGEHDEARAVIAAAATPTPIPTPTPTPESTPEPTPEPTQAVAQRD